MFVDTGIKGDFAPEERDSIPHVTERKTFGVTISTNMSLLSGRKPQRHKHRFEHSFSVNEESNGGSDCLHHSGDITRRGESVIIST